MKVKITGNIVSIVNNNSNSLNSYIRPAFKANEQSGLNIITKPIDKVENIVNSTVDTFVPESQDEEKKKSHKTAIRVGSTVLVLSAIVALLNPKFSSNLVNKLKTKSTKAGNKARIDNSIVGAWNKVKEKSLNGLTNVIQVLNNLNSIKDELFQKLCNKTSVTKKIHQSITKGFDKISRQTVFRKHKNASKQMKMLDDIISQYKGRLSEADKKILDEKIAEIKRMQEYFSSDKTKERLAKQECVMQNLEKEVSDKIKLAKDTVWSKVKGNKLENEMKLKDTCSFWAEDALISERNRLEENGVSIINSLVGDGKTKTGAYRDVVELLSSKLSESEKNALDESLKHLDKSLRKANKTECVEYFDKKRDLLLGGAPTDVLTALASLTASGIAIGVADSKEDRISRFISGALPVFAGLGVSTALTAMLFSGGKGMALGTGSGMVLSALGSAASHKLFPKTNAEGDVYIAENQSANGEVKNA